MKDDMQVQSAISVSQFSNLSLLRVLIANQFLIGIERQEHVQHIHRRL